MTNTDKTEASGNNEVLVTTVEAQRSWKLRSVRLFALIGREKSKGEIWLVKKNSPQFSLCICSCNAWLQSTDWWSIQAEWMNELTFICHNVIHSILVHRKMLQWNSFARKNCTKETLVPLKKHGKVGTGKSRPKTRLVLERLKNRCFFLVFLFFFCNNYKPKTAKRIQWE